GALLHLLVRLLAPPRPSPARAPASEPGGDGSAVRRVPAPRQLTFAARSARGSGARCDATRDLGARLHRARAPRRAGRRLTHGQVVPAAGTFGASGTT